MDHPTLSILTVTFRDLPGLTNTLDSLNSLCIAAGHEIEVIVQDGGTDGIEQMFGQYPSVHFESAPDGGIYEGMNMAIGRSRGQFLWFLNGGDLCVVDEWHKLAEFFDRHPRHLCFFDYDLNLGFRVAQVAARPASYLHHGLPTSHQAIMYPADPVRASGYDLSFRIVGDYELTARLWSAGMPTATLHLPVAEFAAGGTSQQQARKIAIEARRVQREVLHTPLPLRLASRALHLISRVRRRLATRVS